MKVLATQHCEACDGQKQQLHPNWDEYHAMRRHASKEEFFLELGYLPGEPLPPLLIPCRTCRGLGEVEAWLPLEALFPKFLAWYRRTRNEPAGC